MSLLWRNTGLNPQIGPLDARSVFPIGLWLIHMSWWTFGLAALCILALVALGKMGIPVNAAVRRFLSLLLGRHRPTRDLCDFRSRCRW